MLQNFEQMVEKLSMEFSGNIGQGFSFQRYVKDFIPNITYGIECHLVHEYSKMLMMVSGAIVLIRDKHPLVVWEKHLHYPCHEWKYMLVFTIAIDG